MASTVGDPFLLASYPLPSRATQTKKTGTRQRASQLLHASHSRLPRSEDGQVTVAAQGDGVHVLDLAALHPVSSHTLGPSTTYACAPAAFLTFKDEKGVRRIYVAVESAPDIKEEDRGRTVWSWIESLPEDLGASSQAKQTFTVSHRVSQIFAPEALNSDIILLSPEGELTRTDADFRVRNHCPPLDSTHSLLKTFVFPRRTCDFVPSSKVPSTGILVLNFVVTLGELRLQTVALGQDGQLAVLDVEKIPVKAQDIADISCDPSGHLSVLTLDGYWYTCRIHLINDSVTISSTGELMRLNNLSFVKQIHTAPSRNAADEVALLSIGSSHVLLASITTSSTPEIALLLWDIQYSVLLDSHMLAVPSTLPKLSPSTFSLSLVPGSSSYALLILCPTVALQKASGQSKSTTSSVQPRSSVLVVPFSVPSSSTIARAMGLASRGTKWLIEEGTDTTSLQGMGVGNVPTVTARKDLLRRMQEAMEENRPEDANIAFFKWVENESAKRKEIMRKFNGQWEAAGCETEEASAKEGAGLKPQEENKLPPRGENNSSLGHAFTSRLLAIVLESGDQTSRPYSSKVLHYLLEMQAVSNSMIEGGVLRALSLRGDWETISMVLRKVIDIPESEVLRVLLMVVESHRQHAAGSVPVNTDTMVIDQQAAPSTQIPPLHTFLAACLPYPASTNALRTAFREHFSNTENLLCLLEVLEGWLAKWSTNDFRLVLNEVVTNERGMVVPKPIKTSWKTLRRRAGDLPDLEGILSFLQAILDSSFIALLQFKPSHKILKKLFMHLDPQVTLTEELELIRGPLEPFARAQAKALADAYGGRKKELDIDSRRRRKQAHDQSGIAVGLYQVEELIF